MVSCSIPGNFAISGGKKKDINSPAPKLSFKQIRMFILTGYSWLRVLVELLTFKKTSFHSKWYVWPSLGKGQSHEVNIFLVNEFKKKVLHLKNLREKSLS